MRRIIRIVIFTIILSAACISLTNATTSLQAQATVRIDITAPLSKINPLIYGQFIEHLGMCIKDGLWTPEYADHALVLGGVRQELYDLIKQLNIPLLRWPGGCFSDGYHWMDGIGPAAGRPERRNLAWARDAEETPSGPRENNAFGTDEFLRLCENLGIAPLINVNLGSGTAEEARQWVEYANGAANTPMGALRAQNGHPDPYNVTYWGIGNESWGDYEIGWFKTGGEYATKYLEFARAMKSADPDIRLLGVGIIPAQPNWNGAVLRAAGSEMDFLSLHVYFPGFVLVPTWKNNKKQEYYGIVSSGRELDVIMDAFDEQIRENAPPGSHVQIALDEWNLWWDEQQIVRGGGYEFSAALFTADILVRLMRRGDRVAFANLAQLVNVLPLIVTDRQKGIFVTPGYYVFDLFRNYIKGDTLLKTETQSPTYSNKDYGLVRPRKDNPAIEAAGIASADGKHLDVILINKHYDTYIQTEVEINGATDFRSCSDLILTADSPHFANSFDAPHKIEGITKGRGCHVHKNIAHYEAPPHSVVLLSLE